MKRLFAIVIFLLLASSLSAQSAFERAADDFVKGEMERQKIPGVSIAVIKDGKPVIVKGYGFANLEHQVPVKPETIFQSGSVGKQFTAAAVMLLVEDGRIALDAKIDAYLGNVPDSWSGITVRHLLSHTSGLTDYPQSFDFRRDYTEDELLKIAGQIPLAFAPGERWEYSNLGYMVLGVIIGKVTGKFYGEFLRERIFVPLRMTSARIISEADIVPNRAAGYRVVSGEIKNQDWVSPSMNTTADGSLYFSILDLLKWDESLSKRSLLRTGSYDLIWKPTILNSGKPTSYGFGWSLKSVNGRRLIEHGGAWQGFRSFISRYVDDKVSVIVLANSSNANPQRIAHGVAELVDESIKVRPPAGVDPRSSTDLRQLFESVLNKQADRGHFTEDLQTSLFEHEDRLLDHLRKIGPILSFDVIRVETTRDVTVYSCQVQFGSMTIALEIARNKNGKVSRFEVHPE